MTLTEVVDEYIFVTCYQFQNFGLIECGDLKANVTISN